MTKVETGHIVPGSSRLAGVFLPLFLLSSSSFIAAPLHLQSSCLNIPGGRHYPNGAIAVTLSGDLPNEAAPKQLEVDFEGPLTGHRPTELLWKKDGFYFDIRDKSGQVISQSGPFKLARVGIEDASLDQVNVSVVTTKPDGSESKELIAQERRPFASCLKR